MATRRAYASETMNSSKARDLIWAAELLLRRRLVARWRGLD